MNKADAAKAFVEAPELGGDLTAVSTMTRFQPNVEQWNPSWSKCPGSTFSPMFIHDSNFQPNDEKFLEERIVEDRGEESETVIGQRWAWSGGDLSLIMILLESYSSTP